MPGGSLIGVYKLRHLSNTEVSHAQSGHPHALHCALKAQTLLCISFEHFITFLSRMVSVAIINWVLKACSKSEFLLLADL